jgi:endonuclease YncB( thermonuclease family)
MRTGFPALLVVLAMPLAPVSAQVIGGTATVIDGDTLDFTGSRLHLAGIDAPELDQTCLRAGSAWPCGKDAAELLRTRLANGAVQCTATGHSADDGVRFARCRNGTEDLSLAMIGAGLAVALPGDSETAEAEARAKRFSLGLWAAEFEQPAAWRLAHPAPKPKKAAVVRAAPERAAVFRNEWGCAIKGNRSVRGPGRRPGPWIYHLPGMKYYNETRPEELFCTEAEAQAAGYRRSKV